MILEETPTAKSPSKKWRLFSLCIPPAPPLAAAMQGDDDCHPDSHDGEVFDFPRRPPGFESNGSGSGSGSDTGSSSSPANSVHTAPALSPPQRIEEDDDEYYASHPRVFIAPPLRPSVPSSSASTSTARRETMVLPPCPSSQYRGSVRLSCAIAIPARTPPSPPFAISRSSSISSPRVRPPQRTPVPTDVCACTPILLHVPSSSWSSPARLATLLPPLMRRFPVEEQGVPADVDIESGDQECDIIDIDVDEDERTPLPRLPAPIGSPFAAAAYTGRYPPTSRLPFALACSPTPASAPAAPALASLSWPTGDSVYVADTDDEADADVRNPAWERELRSRWSTSTLSSLHSSRAHSSMGALRSPVSPKTFVAFGQYLLWLRSASQSGRVNSALPKLARATPMGNAAQRKGKGKRGKRLTVADVCVDAGGPVGFVPRSRSHSVGLTLRIYWSNGESEHAKHPRAKPRALYCLHHTALLAAARIDWLTFLAFTFLLLRLIVVAGVSCVELALVALAPLVAFVQLTPLLAFDQLALERRLGRGGLGVQFCTHKRVRGRGIEEEADPSVPPVLVAFSGSGQAETAEKEKRRRHLFVRT
ncbi:hypothetical protein C8R44DRAFT_886097 [Mycena epipterygia]|nr:hypothetical protein C8R44DRAFT_886097 [Mycena epipterygia]